MKSTAPIARTHGSASDFTVGPATSWAESLGGGVGEDPRRLGRQTCWAVWQEDLAVFEVQQPRGDYLRSMGTTWRGRTLLHAEEGLWLVERGMLAVRPFGAKPREIHGAHIAAAAATAGSIAPPGSVLKPTALLGRIAHDDGQPSASGSSSNISIETKAQAGRGEEEDAKHGERRELPGLEGALGTGDSSRRNAPAPTSARAGCTAEPSMSEVLPNRNSEGAPTGDARLKAQAKELGKAARGTKEMGRGRMTTAVPGTTQPRAGHKRGRSGFKGGGRGRDGTPTLSVPVGVLHEVVLSQAGVPWECYRAYVELKQRSYVVRRQPEDAVGHDDDTPRAAPLSWYGCPPSEARHRKNPDPNYRSSEANNFHTSTNVNTDSSSSHENRVEPSSCSSSCSSSLPSPAPLPVTFTVYNNQPGSRSFRKSDPGPPDAFVVVCRFGDPMPRHGSLMALAKHHAATKAKADTSARRWHRDDPVAGAGPSPTSAEVSSGRGLVRCGAAESRDGLNGVPHTRERESDPKGGAMNARAQQQQQRCGGGKRALTMRLDGTEEAHSLQPPSGEGEREREMVHDYRLGGGEETARRHDIVMAVEAVGEAVGMGARNSPTGRQGVRLSGDQPLGTMEADHRRTGGEDGGIGTSNAEASGARNYGSVSEAGLEEVLPLARGIKVAVVAGEAGVQLFDVGLHDAGEVAEIVGY